MTTEAHREALSRRINALLNKTVENGCTEEEALTAAAKARALMDQHNLTMTDVQFRAEPIVDFTFERRIKSKTVAADYCLKGIEKYCGVRMWRSGGQVFGLKIRILGMKADTEMARWLYEMIETTVNSQAGVYLKQLRAQGASSSEKRTALVSFGLGMAIRINERLLEMAEALEPVAKTADGTALVLVRNPLVTEAFNKLNLHFGRRSAGLRNGDYAAFSHGQASGDRVNLSRPVGATNAPRLR